MPYTYEPFIDRATTLGVLERYRSLFETEMEVSGHLYPITMDSALHQLSEEVWDEALGTLAWLEDMRNEQHAELIDEVRVTEDDPEVAEMSNEELVDAYELAG
jgi:hypothetical protein